MPVSDQIPSAELSCCPVSIKRPDIDHDAWHDNGFVIAERLLDINRITELHDAFDDLFHGRFETGVQPDEVNWQHGTGDPSLTRQICNGWKADRRIARVVLNNTLGELVGTLMDWPGVRIMIDNVLWKPAGARSLAHHQDSAFLSWFTPSDLCTCWIALDTTSANGGTLELVKGSHRWALGKPEGEFHGPEDYREHMNKAAMAENETVEIVPVEVAAGGGSFHHGHTWHGSGENRGKEPRRAIVLHAMRSDVRYVPTKLHEGIGPIYGRYRNLANNEMNEEHFPIIWRKDGYRTPSIAEYLK